MVSKPPFMATRKKLKASDEELEAFYDSLKAFCLNLPYDDALVSKQNANYERIARICQLFAALKNTKVLNKEKLIDSKAMIYTSNHVGSFDQFYIPLALGLDPIFYLVKKKVTSWPIRWNLIYKPTGAVVVDTNSVSSWLEAKTKLLQLLFNGNKVFIMVREADVEKAI